MKLFGIDLPYGLALAPMAGFSDYAMRRICCETGAEYAVTEMVSAKATIYGDKKTLTLARITPNEPPTALQIFGSEPRVMAEAAEILAKSNIGGALPVAIDINMGCPVNKIYSNGEGSALMKDAQKIYDIVKAVKSSCPIPVTVKLRLGIDRAHINASECALACEEGGADAITLHGRTRADMYSGKADMYEIRKVKEKISVPLFANGDITSGADALRVYAETGADGLMIGRGAVGNPFIFEEIKAAMRGEEYTPPSLDVRKQTALTQLSYAISEKGESAAVREARGQLAKYFHSFRGCAQLRAMINRALTKKDIESAIDMLNEDQ